MNGYKCFWRSKVTEAYANSSYEAQQKAAKELKVKKPHEITVCLCELKGKQVTHKPIG